MLYSKQVLDHFQNPRNQGKISNPDATSQVGNPVCGDIMKIYLKIDKKLNKIKDIKFETLGCGAAIACSSVVTQEAKGKTLENALKIDKSIILKKLGGLPPQKVHCSMLSIEALHKAINDYLKKTNDKKSRKSNRKN
ncbi:MAG TPA: iron-sulfur cluster assembly scaffold protein [bacterium]|jgi:nitrogen fixation NifU-like protein|nr:iron-sulfur cluster assembly scaffold protein [bacterium]HOG38210.1 iron-sulfur cluster assembly scaffold protein [bacterium]HQI03200.1 iron-sulfur cluster assembly scaffold protein [bacterium]